MSLILPTTTDNLRVFVDDLLEEIGKKIKIYAIVDIINNKVVVYYGYTWYKKKIDEERIEDPNPFYIKKRDLLGDYRHKELENKIVKSKKSNISRKLINFFISRKVQNY